MCKPNPNRLKISSGSFESHHWQMRPTFEVRDVETQVVDRHDVQVEFATTPVRFEKPDSRLESRYDDITGTGPILKHFDVNGLAREVID